MSDIFESKWGETKQALTEGLAGNRKKTMDVVLENTKRYLAEQSTAGATSAGNVATLNRVILPVIRRVMPTVIANEIVGVQHWSCRTNPHIKNKICRHSKFKHNCW